MLCNFFNIFNVTPSPWSHYSPFHYRDINQLIIFNKQQMFNPSQSESQHTILSTLSNLVDPSKFWYYHGMILSGLWVFMSAMAILAKSVNTQLHMILFTFIDVTTLFFVSVALYYVFPDIIDGKLMEWSLVKQLHVVCGCAFACLMIYQHIMGITAFLNKKKSSRHRQLGKYLVSFGRIIAAVGWVLGGNVSNAIIVACASIPILIISLLTPPENTGNRQRPQQPISQQKRNENKNSSKNSNQKNKRH